MSRRRLRSISPDDLLVGASLIALPMGAVALAAAVMFAKGAGGCADRSALQLAPVDAPDDDPFGMSALVVDTDDARPHVATVVEALPNAYSDALEQPAVTLDWNSEPLSVEMLDALDDDTFSALELAYCSRVEEVDDLGDWGRTRGEELFIARAEGELRMLAASRAARGATAPAAPYVETLALLPSVGDGKVYFANVVTERLRTTERWLSSRPSLAEVREEVSFLVDAAAADGDPESAALTGQRIDLMEEYLEGRKFVAPPSTYVPAPRSAVPVTNDDLETLTLGIPDTVPPVRRSTPTPMPKPGAVGRWWAKEKRQARRDMTPSPVRRAQDKKLAAARRTEKMRKLNARVNNTQAEVKRLSESRGDRDALLEARLRLYNDRCALRKLRADAGLPLFRETRLWWAGWAAQLSKPGTPWSRRRIERRQRLDRQRSGFSRA